MLSRAELGGEQRGLLMRRGVDLFNRGEYFAAHEAWEEIWRSSQPDPRDLFQGLIQIAAGMHHHRVSHRPAAARRLLARGRGRVAPFAPAGLGLDLGALLAAVCLWEEWLARRELGPAGPTGESGLPAADDVPPPPLLRFL